MDNAPEGSAGMGRLWHGAAGHVLTDEERARGRGVRRAKVAARREELEAQLDRRAGEVGAYILAWARRVLANPATDDETRAEVARAIMPMVARRVQQREQREHTVDAEVVARWDRLIAQLPDGALDAVFGEVEEFRALPALTHEGGDTPLALPAPTAGVPGPHSAAVQETTCPDFLPGSSERIG